MIQFTIRFKKYFIFILFLIAKFGGKKKFIKILFISIFEAVLDIFFLYIIYTTFNSILNNSDLLLLQKYNLDKSLALITAVAIFFTRSLISYFSSIYLVKSVDSSLQKISINFFKKIIFLSKDLLGRFKESELISFMNTELRRVSHIYIDILEILKNLILLFFLFAFLIYKNTNNLILLIIIFISFLGFFIILGSKYFKKKSDDLRNYSIKQINFSSNLIRHANDIKNFFAFNFFIKGFIENTFNTKKIVILKNKINYLSKFFLETFILSTLLVYFILLLVRFNLNDALASFLLLFIVGLRLIQPLKLLTTKITSIKLDTAMLANFVNLYNFLDKHPLNYKEEKVNYNEDNFGSHFEKLELKNISFNYNKNVILNNLYLSINKFDKIGIFGVSGVGKSTLIDIITGKLTSKHGLITINGKEINNKDLLNFVSNKISIVSQQSNLLNASLLENIAFGIDENLINQDLVVKAIHEAGLNNFFNLIEKNTNFFINDDSKNISEGEKKRILIARSFYFSKEIIILDEATVNVDADIQLEIIQNILDKKDITVVIISHNLSIINMCNKIYELKNGSLELINNIKKK
jgi:ABC-type multidrug transport system fused ATPase/permease subunit